MSVAFRVFITISSQNVNSVFKKPDIKGSKICQCHFFHINACKKKKLFIFVYLDLLVEFELESSVEIHKMKRISTKLRESLMNDLLVSALSNKIFHNYVSIDLLDLLNLNIMCYP